MISSFNNFIYKAWAYIFNRLLMAVPFHQFRLIFLSLSLGKLGKKCSFLLNCELRHPQKISIGDHCVFNRGVLLDGRGDALTIGSNVDVAQRGSNLDVGA
jgi:acetyltransferase-like isoleucine patch superfamily enzyme